MVTIGKEDVEMTDLKPCPFCGGPGEEWEEEGGYPWLFIKVVGCHKCHVTFYNDNGDEGVEKWNRRVVKE